MSDGRRREVLACLALAGAVLLFWSPLLRGGSIYPSGDLTNLFWPQRMHVARSVADGVIPLWNPHTFLGSPFLASMQPGVFDPTTWLSLRSPDDPVALLRAFNVQRLLILLILAMNTFALARAGLGVGRGPAVLAALIASCSGFLWGHFDHPNQMSAMAWYPLALLGALRVLGGAGLGASLLIAIAVALQIFAGHPQHVALGAVSIGLVAAVALTVSRSPFRVWLRAGALIGSGYLLGAMIAAIQLIPSLELARQSERIFDPPEYAASFSMEPVFLLRLLWPGLFGFFPDYARQANYSEIGLFVGRIPLALALLALVWARGGERMERGGVNHRVLGAALGALALFALLWSLGSHGPLFGPLTALVPPLRSFRVPPRMLFHFDLSLALLAGLGLHALLSRLRHAHWSGRRVRAAAAITVLLSVLDLWAASRSEYFRRPAEEEFAQEISPAQVHITARDAVPRLYRLQMTDTDYYVDPRPMALARRLMRLQPNAGALWGITHVGGYTEGLLPTARWSDLRAHLYRNLHQRELDAEALGLLGVPWVLAESWAMPISEATLQPVLEFGYPEEGARRSFTLYENPLALPPVVPREVLEMLAPIEALDGDWSRGVADQPVARRAPVQLMRPGARWPGADDLPPLPVRRDGPNALVVSNPDAFEGEAVLIQASSAGWVAIDDTGGHQALRPLNAAWSAWTIPPGAREITLHFEPASHRLSCLMSLIGVLVLVAAAARTRPEGRRSRRESSRPA